MSKSKYILNFNELADDLIPELRSLSKNVRREPFELNDDIDKKIQEILNKLPKNTSLENIIYDVRNFIDFLQRIDELKGEFHIDAKFKNIPAIKSDYEIVFNYDTSIYITGIVFSLSAWKENDMWSLEVDDKVIFDKVTTKEVGDKKFFNIPYFVEGGKNIKLIFHNNSGNSRQVWFDLEFIMSLFADRVLIRCLDTKGNILRMYYTGVKAGELQKVYAPSIDYCYLVTLPNYVEKIFTATDNVVTFIYDRNIVIHVKCVDKKTRKVLNEYNLEIKPSVEEAIFAPLINGYSNVGAESITKAFTNGDEVIFEYAKTTMILIRCIDEYGQVLKTMNQSVVEGNITTINAPTIDGYFVNSTNPITGAFIEGDVVEFTYSHPWSVKVIMEWEGNSLTDVDMYGFYDSTVVYYGHKKENNKLWLDVDSRNHIGNTTPEILTCDYNTGKLVIGVNNYNGIPLSKSVNFTIKKYDSSTKTEQIIKQLDITFLNDKHVYAVCEIDLATKKVIELNHSTILR